MEHFSIVQALCRAAIADASPASRRQIERLQRALDKDGNFKQSALLTNILTGQTEQQSPSVIERSTAPNPANHAGRPIEEADLERRPIVDIGYAGSGLLGWAPE